MIKSVKRIIYITLMIAAVLSLLSCGKKRKHNWIEVGAEKTTEKITPGVHPERGSISDATPIETAIIYVPIGIQEKEESVTNPNGTVVKVPRYKNSYRTVLYDLNEITPESIDMALKDLKVLGEDSEFYGLKIVDDDSENNRAAGPGASGTLNKKGILSYVDYISSPIDNSDEYEDKGTNGKDLIGKISLEDIVHCVTETYISNFNLTTCEMQLVNKDGTKIEENDN
jgi:hypothetical protein